jgi:hypothetical protein
MQATAQSIERRVDKTKLANGSSSLAHCVIDRIIHVGTLRFARPTVYDYSA